MRSKRRVLRAKVKVFQRQTKTVKKKVPDR